MKSHYHKEPSQEFKDGMAVLRLCGVVSRAEYLEAMWAMAHKYPGRGWTEQAIELEKRYETQHGPVQPGLSFKGVLGKI